MEVTEIGTRRSPCLYTQGVGWKGVWVSGKERGGDADVERLC